jgi:hypothetical protein
MPENVVTTMVVRVNDKDKLAAHWRASVPEADRQWRGSTVEVDRPAQMIRDLIEHALGGDEIAVVSNFVEIEFEERSG